MSGGREVMCLHVAAASSLLKLQTPTELLVLRGQEEQLADANA